MAHNVQPQGPSQAHENRRCFPAGMLLQLLLHRRLLQRAAQIGAELFLMLAQVHRLCNAVLINAHIGSSGRICA